MAKAPKAEKADTPKLDKGKESNREEPMEAWDYQAIADRLGKTLPAEYNETPPDVMIAIAINALVHSPIQEARLIACAHALNLFGLDDDGNPEAVYPDIIGDLCEVMGTTPETVRAIVDQSVDKWTPYQHHIWGVFGEQAEAADRASDLSALLDDKIEDFANRVCPSPSMDDAEAAAEKALDAELDAVDKELEDGGLDDKGS